VVAKGRAACLSAYFATYAEAKPGQETPRPIFEFLPDARDYQSSSGSEYSDQFSGYTISV
jgi:hypothetical protein